MGDKFNDGSEKVVNERSHGSEQALKDIFFFDY